MNVVVELLLNWRLALCFYYDHPVHCNVWIELLPIKLGHVVNNEIFRNQEEGEDVEEKDPKERSKLHRRDTPHYLKNKRIHEPIDKEKAMALIANALKKQELTQQQSNNQSDDDGEGNGVLNTEAAEDEERLPTPPPPPLPARNEVIAKLIMLPEDWIELNLLDSYNLIPYSFVWWRFYILSLFELKIRNLSKSESKYEWWIHSLHPLSIHLEIKLFVQWLQSLPTKDGKEWSSLLNDTIRMCLNRVVDRSISIDC